MAEEGDVDVTAAIDKYDDEWSDDDDDDRESIQAISVEKSNLSYQDEVSGEDVENRPPKNIVQKSAAQSRNLNTIPEESQSHYSSSRYSQQNKNRGSHGSTTERTNNPAFFSQPEPRKNSISFENNSFVKCDDFETVVKQKEERERLKENYFRSHQNVTNVSKMDSYKIATNVSHQRSTTPPNSNTSTRSIPHNSSKPLTSTPISTRNGSRLKTDVSKARSSQNESSVLSESKINYIIKDIDLNQSSIRNAKNFVLHSKQIPKQSTILDELKKKREEKNSFLRFNSSSSNSKHRQTAALPIPTLPRVVEREAFPSRPSTSTSTVSAEIAIKPNPLSNWGFIPVNEEVQAKIYVRNCSSHLLEVIPKLSTRINSFRLASKGPVQIHPNCSHEFIIIFSPTECKRYHQTIHFYVASSGKNYSHKLLGYGGTADVKIVEKRSLSFFPRSGVYRFAPTNISSFGFEVENNGDRAAFVYIVAVDTNGIEARSITVEPKSFCLIPKSNNPNDPSKANIIVKIPDNYAQQMCRMSMDSVRSSTTVTKNNVFSLKIYFGDERLRQRAKKYSDDVNKHESFQGLWLTQTPFHINGHEMNAIDNYLISIQDLETLKTQTRVLTLLIGDDRIEKRVIPSLPSRPPSSFSHRDHIGNGYYIPECNNECDSTMISVADSNRTRMN